MVQPAPIDPPEIENLLWSGFGKGTLGLDVGANCGQSVPHMLRLADLVHAFEPSVESYEVLQSAYANNDQVKTFEKAVSEETSIIKLVAAPTKIATGQLVTHGTAGMEWSDEELRDGVEREISAIALDDTYPDTPVSFIKIDVEGHEYLVLLGAMNLIRAQRPEMLIEIHSQLLGDQIEELLHPLYRLNVIRHPHYSEGTELWRTHFWMQCFRD